MKIDFWDCRYGEYEESYVDGEESCYLNCTHPEGIGVCILDDVTPECSIAERKKENNNE